MGTLSFEAKKAYAARTRKSNYLASLRLEGFKTSLADSNSKLPSRDEILNALAKPRR
ncbi:hypothetical protein SAMN05216600_10130 [Pseudomonas cuatrocienegasensis]|uniref:DUF2559 domain-containing protein n=1 Tax=Pseudomonas cuatrocienegasensis TaxID=543360 RepID=A0ABY1AZS0_9PSED|nr:MULTISPECIES: YhfG family protein [Pseudomonas]SEP59634.1 hypothetical protein SAMN05216600_10130 [Pseudomonas cuatrocienegasensis]